MLFFFICSFLCPFVFLFTGLFLCPPVQAHSILLSFCFSSSVHPFLYLPDCAWPSFHLFVLLSGHQSIYLSFHLSWCLFLCPFVCPSIDPLSTALFICLSNSLMIHRFVCLSFYLLLVVCQFVRWAILPFFHRSLSKKILIRQFFLHLFDFPMSIRLSVWLDGLSDHYRKCLLYIHSCVVIEWKLNIQHVVFQCVFLYFLGLLTNTYV